MTQRTAAATIAATTWVPTYGPTSRHPNRLPTARPTVTAGLKWPPETCPTAYAITSTLRPKANATPSRPMPTVGKAAARTAAPQPVNTRAKVPTNSAPSRRPVVGVLAVPGIGDSLRRGAAGRRTTARCVTRKRRSPGVLDASPAPGDPVQDGGAGPPMALPALSLP